MVVEGNRGTLVYVIADHVVGYHARISLVHK